MLDYIDLYRKFRYNRSNWRMTKTYKIVLQNIGEIIQKAFQAFTKLWTIHFCKACRFWALAHPNRSTKCKIVQKAL